MLKVLGLIENSYFKSRIQVEKYRWNKKLFPLRNKAEQIDEQKAQL